MSSNNALHFLSPVNPPNNAITNTGEASGSTIITNYSVDPSGTAAIGNIKVRTLSDGTLALAIADLNLNTGSNPGFSLISTSSAAFAQDGIYQALANSQGTIVGSFSVDAQESFSFDFSTSLDVAAKTSNPNSEFAEALGESTFVLLNAQTTEIVDYFTVSGGVVTTEDNDFFLLNHTDNVNLRTSNSDYNFGGTAESISGFYQGSYEYTPRAQTDLVLAELNTSYVNLSGDFLIDNLGRRVTYGSLNNDRINGSRRGDKIYASLGDDVVDGKYGNDTIEGGYGNDVLKGNRGNDRLGGALGDDELYGGYDDDLLMGGLGNDHLEGGLGDDTLYGNEGNDVIEGGKGDDILYGDGNVSAKNRGADRFVFEHNFLASSGGDDDDDDDGNSFFRFRNSGGDDDDDDDGGRGDYDIIKDFQPGVDKVEFQGRGKINSEAWYNQGVASRGLVDTRAGAVLQISSSEQILFEGVDVNELSYSDFMFS